MLMVGSPGRIFKALPLRAAATQATIALHESRQRRAARHLERRVAERTAQLTRSNEELSRREWRSRAVAPRSGGRPTRRARTRAACPEGCIIIDNRHQSVWLRHATLSPPIGNVNWKTAPHGAFAVAHSRPPWASIIERLIDSPMPKP